MAGLPAGGPGAPPEEEGGERGEHQDHRYAMHSWMGDPPAHGRCLLTSVIAIDTGEEFRAVVGTDPLCPCH